MNLQTACVYNMKLSCWIISKQRNFSSRHIISRSNWDTITSTFSSNSGNAFISWKTKIRNSCNAALIVLGKIHCLDANTGESLRDFSITTGYRNAVTVQTKLVMYVHSSQHITQREVIDETSNRYCSTHCRCTSVINIGHPLSARWTSVIILYKIYNKVNILIKISNPLSFETE